MDSNSDYDDTKPNYANLPTEIILEILSYLNYGDQCAASLTCTRWLDASVEYISKTTISFSKVCLSDDSEPGEIFLNTNRQYKNLKLIDVVLCQSEKFFEKLGNWINNISFINLDINEKQFCSILCNFKYITELTIENNSSLLMAGQFLESQESQYVIKDCLANIKKLSLRSNSYLSDAMLMRLITLIDNLESLDLSNCHIACHNAVQKRFYPPYIDIPSESILTLKYLIVAITTQASTLNELNLSETLIDATCLSAISAIEDLKLKKVSLKLCRQFNLGGIIDFIETQPNLIELDLSSCELVGDGCIKLFLKFTKLEVLRLKRCTRISDDSTKLLPLFKKLKILDLSNCIHITSNGIKDNLVKEKNENMIELYLNSINLFEDCVMQCAINLPNLKVFDLGYCCNGVTATSLNIIYQNQKLLRDLNLQSCNMITDAAITGCISNDFIIKENSNNSKENSLLSLVSKSSNILLPSSVDGDKGHRQIIEKEEKPNTILLNINDQDISINQLKGLEILNLSSCPKISDISLKCLKFNELRNLNISNCRNISSHGIECLIKNCNAIENIDISYCNLSSEVIDIIQENLKRLKVLNCAGCP